MPHGLKGVLVGLGNPLLDISAGGSPPPRAPTFRTAYVLIRANATQKCTGALLERAGDHFVPSHRGSMNCAHKPRREEDSSRIDQRHAQARARICLIGFHHAAFQKTLIQCCSGAVVPKETVEKYGLKLNNAILAEEQHLPVYQARRRTAQQSRDDSSSAAVENRV